MKRESSLKNTTASAELSPISRLRSYHAFTSDVLDQVVGSVGGRYRLSNEWDEPEQRI